MRKSSFILLVGILLPVSANATLVGDLVSGCFSDSGCSAGVGGSFSSSSATVSEGAVEFSGSQSGFDITADILTFNGNSVIRLALADPSNLDPTLAGGWEFAIFDLDWMGPTELLIDAHTDTTFQFAEIDSLIDPAVCNGDSVCEEVVAEVAATAKLDSVIPVDTIATTPDSIVITLGALSTGTFEPLSIDIVLQTQVVPEPSTALLVALGVVALSGRLRRVR